MASLPAIRNSPPPTPRRRRRGVRILSKRDVLVVSLMLGVPILLDLAFIWFPTLISVLLSFTNWNGIGGVKAIHVVGGDNYHQLTSIYPPFWPAVEHNVIWLAVFIGFATPLGMLFAVILDRNLRGSRIYQSVLFLPVMLSLALIGIIWEFVYSSNYGLINTVIGHTNNNNLIDWLGNSHLNLWAVLVEASWRQAGYVMVLYLAGLKAVDVTLKEAALIDGANAWQTFWRVTFPVLRPVNIVILVVTVIESLRAFDLVYITNQGVNGLELLSVLITRNILGEETRIGFASAIGVVLLVISLIPITIFLRQQFRQERAR
ncbi:MAG: sugar ABC transporter permease [Candidatus Dormibacteraeota bacterium]|nr:sugar ABC transporter permease [Candidatus Dormibacteraeota bacterium]